MCWVKPSRVKPADVIENASSLRIKQPQRKHLILLFLHFRAISHDLHLFLKRPSQSSTAGMDLSIRWLFPRSRGLAWPSLSTSSSSTTGLAFCFISELRESFARTEEEALVWLQILQPVLVSSDGKSYHYVVIAFYLFFVCSPTQYSHLLLF